MNKNDGGPAFPSRDYQTDTVLVDGHEEYWQGWIVKPGMTYRQWLVGKIAGGYCANPECVTLSKDNLAEHAIVQADVIIKAEQASQEEKEKS